MNVELAAQTLSASVANSLEFLKTESEDFRDVDATVEFIRKINDIFDVMNSTERSQSAETKPYKRPLSTGTEQELFRLFIGAIDYIQELEIEIKGRIVPVLSSDLFTAFFGFIHNMENLMKIYDDYVATGKLSVLYTHRMSQDLLETFFACIRSMNGMNDNPTCAQFEAAYRKLSVHNDVVCSKKANCIDKGTKMLTVSSARKTKFKTNSAVIATDPELDHFEEDFANQILFGDSCQSVSDDLLTNNLQTHILAHSASLVEKKIIMAKGSRKLVKCNSCISAFVENEVAQNRFIEFKSRKENMLSPCKSTIQICKFADSYLNVVTNAQAKYEQILLRIMRNLSLDGLYPLTNFDDENHDGNNHKFNFVKNIVGVYLDLKSIQNCKSITLDSHYELVRSDLIKKIHRLGQ